MVIAAGKTVDFQGIAGFLMGLKPDIISINHHPNQNPDILIWYPIFIWIHDKAGLTETNSQSNQIKIDSTKLHETPSCR